MRRPRAIETVDPPTIGSSEVNRVADVHIGDLPTVVEVAIKTSALYFTAVSHRHHVAASGDRDALLLVAHAVLARLRLAPALCRFIDPPLVVLINDGKLNRRNLRRCSLTAADLEAALREHGHRDSAGVHSAILEAKGDFHSE